MLTVEKIDTPQGMAALQPVWDELLSRYDFRNLFLTHEWISTWWAHFGTGSDLWVLLVRDGDTPLGIAPMMVRREWYGGLPVRMLGFPMNRHTSRADFILPERKEESIEALVRYWRDHSGSWDVLRLVHVQRESGNLKILQEMVNTCGLRDFQAVRSRQILHLPIDGTWEDYLGRQPHRFRKNLNNCLHRARKAGIVDMCPGTDPSGIERSMDLLFGLEKESWKSNSREAAFDRADRDFHRSVAMTFGRTGRYFSRFIMHGEAAIGGYDVIEYDNVWYGILIHYCERYADLSPGRQMYSLLLQAGFAKPELREIDFNSGLPYIRDWTDRWRDYESLSACNAMPYSRLIGGVKRIKRAWQGLKTAGGAARHQSGNVSTGR